MCRLATNEFSLRCIPFKIRHGPMQFRPQKQSVFEQYTIFQKETFKAIFHNFHHQSSRLPFFPKNFFSQFSGRIRTFNRKFYEKKHVYFSVFVVVRCGAVNCVCKCILHCTAYPAFNLVSKTYFRTSFMLVYRIL
jgi:hypothetical protein